jgi:DNA gyrase subunit A
LNASLTNGSNHIVIAKSEGKAVHFNESQVRPMGRTAAGVRGVTLDSPTDKSLAWFVSHETMPTCWLYQKMVTANVLIWKITASPIVAEKGVKTINVTEKTGKLVAIKEVGDDDELMIINRSGITIRIEVKQLRVMGRATQGVRLIKLNDDDRISSVEKIQKIEGALNPESTDTTGSTNRPTNNN